MEGATVFFLDVSIIIAQQKQKSFDAKQTTYFKYFEDTDSRNTNLYFH